MLNRYQLEYIATSDLLRLQSDIKQELKKRTKEYGLARRLAKIDGLDIPQPLKPNSKEIERRNSSGLLAIPCYRSRKAKSNSIYLQALIDQDWSHLYNGGDSVKKYYVYCHVDIKKAAFVAYESCGGNYGGEPFYIGKGTGDRAFNLKRNQGHGKRLTEIIANNVPVDRIVKIVFSGLSEAKAFELEAKLIYFFGTIYNKNIKKFGVLYNLDTPIIPEFTGDMEIMPGDPISRKNPITKNPQPADARVVK